MAAAIWRSAVAVYDPEEVRPTASTSTPSRASAAVRSSSDVADVVSSPSESTTTTRRDPSTGPVSRAASPMPS